MSPLQDRHPREGGIYACIYMDSHLRGNDVIAFTRLNAMPFGLTPFQIAGLFTQVAIESVFPIFPALSR